MLKTYPGITLCDITLPTGEIKEGTPVMVDSIMGLALYDKSVFKINREEYALFN